MKICIFFAAIAISVFSVNAQTTGFVLTDSAKIYRTTCFFSDTAVAGKSYRFDLTGFYSGPDSLSSYVIWTKSYSQRSIPVKIVVDMMSPSYATGVTRIAIGLDTNSSGPIRGIANSGFVYIYPGSGWQTKTFTIQANPGAIFFRRLGFAFSLIQGESGYRTAFIDNIRLVSVSGDTIMLDNADGIPPTPILLSPTNGTTNVSTTPTLRWNASLGATSYRLQVTLASGAIVFDNSGVANTFQQISGLQNSTVYYWRVNATNSNGTSDWSVTWSFTTAAVSLNAPILVSPQNGATGVPISALLVWNVVTHSNLYNLLYNLEVSTASSFSEDKIIFRKTSNNTNAVVTNLEYSKTYYWRVKAISSSGDSGPWSSIWNFMTVGITSNVDENKISKEFKLVQNYPNPFNSNTTIEFQLPSREFVTLKVMNILGQEIELLVNEEKEAGTHRIVWNAGPSYPSGLYLYRLETEKHTATKKMIFLK